MQVIVKRQKTKISDYSLLLFRKRLLYPVELRGLSNLLHLSWGADLPAFTANYLELPKKLGKTWGKPTFQTFLGVRPTKLFLKTNIPQNTQSPKSFFITDSIRGEAMFYDGPEWQNYTYIIRGMKRGKLVFKIGHSWRPDLRLMRFKREQKLKAAEIIYQKNFQWKSEAYEYERRLQKECLQYRIKGEWFWSIEPVIGVIR